jgi:uncharacterized protein
MAAANVSLDTIHDFLAQKRIALVGISRERQNIGPQLFDEFLRRGYEVFPVNPKARSMSGHRCFASVHEIQPAPDAALLLTSPVVTNSVVRDCHEAGIRYIWMYRGGGHGAVSPEAVEFCRAHEMQVIPGQCPFMYLDPVRSIHRLHRFLVKITGSYPRHVLAR